MLDSAAGWRSRGIWRMLCAEQRAAEGERRLASAVGEEPEVTDAHQALGQNME